MKFTEGYWLRKECVQASYASQAYTIERIPHGIRIAAPERPIRSRADSLDITVLYVDIVSSSHNDIEVRASHFMAYDEKEPRFELHTEPDDVEVEELQDETVLTAGDMKVRVSRKDWNVRFEADGRLLTSCGFRNLAYFRVNKQPTKLSMVPDYFAQDYAPYMEAELSVKPGETVYGLGERFTPFVKNGQVVDMWNEDGGTSSSVSYKNIPFYMTSEHYGVFVDHAGQVSYEINSEKVEYVGFSVPGEQLRFHVIYGRTPADIIDVYTRLTGRPALPPEWSFGLWLSTSFKPSYDEKTTDALVEGMQQRDIPFSVFHFDCYWLRGLHWCDFVWDPVAFPDPKRIIDKYHKKGLKVCCWTNPYVAQNTDMFREGVEKGYFLMRADGKGVKQVDNWQPGMAIVDFTNPDAAAWFAGKIRELLQTGVDAIKTDFGERIPVDVVYHDGSNPVDMHNYYTFLYNRTVFRTIEEERGKNQAVLFARSATAGSQQFPVHWGGDCFASYASMAETLHAGLSFAMSGFAFWSHDISGFESTATPDLYKRWVQFGMFSTHSRLHGSDTYRVPWIFDEESVDVVRTFSRLKCRLMPYIYRMAAIAHEKGTPVCRPMPFAYPDDRACQYLDLQYMFGESILVAPIFNDQSIGECYLPDGKWISLLDSEVLEGGKWHRKKYSYLDFPVFVRENSLLAIGSHDDRPDYDYTDGVTFRYYLPKDGAIAFCEVPDESGKTVLSAKAILENGEVRLELDREMEGAVFEAVLPDGSRKHAKIEGKTAFIRL